MSKKVKIGVTGTGSLIGQAIIKSITTSDLKDRIVLIGFDCFEQTVGSFWVEKNYITANLLDQKTRWLDWLDSLVPIIKKEKIKLLFIGVDFELRPLAAHKEEIEKLTGCKIIVSSQEVVAIADDKYLTYKFLKKHGLSYPSTFLPEQLKTVRINYPCVLKPRVGARSRGVFVIKDKIELENKLPLVDNPIVQELAGNSNSEYTCGVIFFENEVKAMIALRRDLKEGNTSVAYYSDDTPTAIYDYIKKTAEYLKPYGACNFQLQMDRNGVPKLFEINARHSGTTYIRSLFGFKEVEYIIKYLLGWKTKPFILRTGLVKRYFEEFYVK